MDQVKMMRMNTKDAMTPEQIAERKAKQKYHLESARDDRVSYCFTARSPNNNFTKDLSLVTCSKCLTKYRLR